MKYLARLKSEKQPPDKLPKPPKPPFDSFGCTKKRHFPESKGQDVIETPPTEEDRPKVDWLKPCPICSGDLFTESDRGGYFCCECQTLSEGAKLLRIVQSKVALKSAVKITKRPRKQINCQAYEQTGVLASTGSEHCREWQGPYCKGCALLTTI